MKLNELMPYERPPSHGFLKNEAWRIGFEDLQIYQFLEYQMVQSRSP